MRRRSSRTVCMTVHDETDAQYLGISSRVASDRTSTVQVPAASRMESVCALAALASLLRLRRTANATARGSQFAVLRLRGTIAEVQLLARKALTLSGPLAARRCSKPAMSVSCAVAVAAAGRAIVETSAATTARVRPDDLANAAKHASLDTFGNVCGQPAEGCRELRRRHRAPARFERPIGPSGARSRRRMPS